MITFCPKERRRKGFSEMIKRTMNRQVNKSNAIDCCIDYYFQRVRKRKGVKYEKSLRFEFIDHHRIELAYITKKALAF